MPDQPPAPLRLLLVASPVAPLGGGPTGGVSRHLEGLARALLARGHAVTVLAPEGSRLAAGELVEVRGTPQPSAVRAAGEAYPIPREGVLAAMMRAALHCQGGVDAIVSFAHDWLPYYLTAFFSTPLLHVANLPALGGATDGEILRTSRAWPLRVGMLSRAQAASYRGLHEPWWLVPGLDVAAIPQGAGGGPLAWAGRISPEKGLEDAAEAARLAGLKLQVAGVVEDAGYFEAVLRAYGDVVEPQGHLAPAALYALLGGARALLQTPRVAEAFGMASLEALACGTPVIAYDRGAAGEIVEDGVTGFVVPAGDAQAAAARVGELAVIARPACRASVLAHFSLDAMADNALAWLALALGEGGVP